MKRLLLLFALAGLALILTGCAKAEDISNLQSQIDELKSDKISSIESQIAAINRSVNDLKDANETVNDKIADLKAAADAQQKLIDALKDADKALGKKDNALEARIATLEGQVAVINGQIKTLEDADKAINTRIDELKTYVDEELVKAKNWASTTFATLAQYQQTAANLATLSVTVSSISTTLAEVKTSITGLDTKIDGIDAALQGKITDAKTELEGKIADLKTELEGKITEAISTSEASLQGWVNEKLSAYYTAAQMDVKIAELKSKIDALDSDNEANKTKIAELETKLNNLSTELEQATATIKTEYEAAIQQAIEEYNGTITQTIQSKIDQVNTTITALTGRVEDLELAVSTLQADVAALKAMIQTVAIIPAYNDGSLKAENGILTINCVITPKKAVDGLTKENFTVLTSEVLTKAGLYGTIAIANDEDLVLDKENGTATIKVDISAVLPNEADMALTIALNVKSGISDFTTDFVPVYVSDYVSVFDLSSNGTANCYIVPVAGLYKFLATVKGNSNEPVGTPVAAEVLWESFGTSTAPKVGDIIKSVSIKNGYIQFETPKTLANGNAVIAVKDNSGTILWSWHIWVCKDFDPVATEQVYKNNAGTMMDRNLGATSARPGDTHALGLLYQWGRKDPFVNRCSMDFYLEAKSTNSIQFENSSIMTGTIPYSISKPTTFLIGNYSNNDWYYSEPNDTDNTRWGEEKTIYDPCPHGWKVPTIRVWTVAFGKEESFLNEDYNENVNGCDFGANANYSLGIDASIWYPALSYRNWDNGKLHSVYPDGAWNWSCDISGKDAFYFSYGYMNSVYPKKYGARAAAHSVRCCKEN